MRTTGTADRVRRARTNQPKLEVVVGFDSEWVDASHADDGIPPTGVGSDNSTDAALADAVIG